MHYNRFRYYDADVGRFVSHDPIGLAGGQNIYVYAPNPTGWVDSLGLTNKKPIDCAKGAKIFAKRKAEIQSQIEQHDYADIGHAGAKPSILGGVSGAIVNERATGLRTGGNFIQIKVSRLETALRKY